MILGLVSEYAVRLGSRLGLFSFIDVLQQQNNRI